MFFLRIKLFFLRLKFMLVHITLESICQNSLDSLTFLMIATFSKHAFTTLRVLLFTKFVLIPGSEKKNEIQAFDSCYLSKRLDTDFTVIFTLPRARATAKNGIWSMTVLRRTGPLWLSLGLFQTTRFTPDFLITLLADRGGKRRETATFLRKIIDKFKNLSVRH